MLTTAWTPTTTGTPETFKKPLAKAMSKRSVATAEFP
jgi:hypothetical protein